MRLSVFVISAAVLHVVLLAIHLDNSSHKGDELLVGVTLVQRRMAPLVAATDSPSDRQPPVSTGSAGHPPVETATNQVGVVEVPVKRTETVQTTAAVAVNHRAPKPQRKPLPGVEQSTEPAAPDIVQEPPSAVSVTTVPPADMPPLTVPQNRVPTADRPVESRSLSVLPALPAEGVTVISARARDVDGVQDANNPSVQVAAQPRYGYHPAPAYPELARRRGWEGTVEFHVRVLVSGAVGEVTLKRSSGYKSLDHAARRTIRDWRFTPARRAGSAVESWVVIPIHFVLDADPRLR